MLFVEVNYFLYNKRMTPQKQSNKLAGSIVSQMIQLSTAGFGLVAALAWNSVIQEFVSVYIKPHLPKGSGVLSLLLYAIVITILAVTVTYQLSKLLEKIKTHTS